MNNLSITNRKWKEFFLEEVVSINGGKRLTKADMELGDMPFIGASEMSNGITAFTCSTNDSLDSNVLGVNYNGSVGFSFYHPYKAIFSDDVKRIKWLDSSRNNRYTLLFLSSMIGQQKCKFAYGYKFNAQRMKRQKILLPVCADGTIDWLFMEEYMRLKERQVLKPTIDKLCKQLITNELMGGVNRFTLIGKHSTLQRYSLKFSVVSVLKKQTTKLEILPMYHQHHSTMGLMVSSAMMAA